MQAFVRASMVVVFAFGAWACDHASEQLRTKLPAGLVLLPGAQQVTHGGDDRSVSIGYEVDLPFPAGALLDAVNRALGEHWPPLNDLWLNPGVPSSHVTGWTYFPDGRHYWSGQWRSADDRMVEYVLQYQSATPGDGHTLSQPDNARLRVNASHYSSAYVLSVEDELKNRRIGHEPPRGRVSGAVPGLLPHLCVAPAFRGLLHPSHGRS
jgi:hypothetical protein